MMKISWLCYIMLYGEVLKRQSIAHRKDLCGLCFPCLPLTSKYTERGRELNKRNTCPMNVLCVCVCFHKLTNTHVFICTLHEFGPGSLLLPPHLP